MKVKELIDDLQRFDPEDAVLLSTDVEGNSIRIVEHAEYAFYEPYDNGWEVELIDPDEQQLGDLTGVVLWPVN